ncbi:NAD(P)-dependent oxidoreductase [Nocardia cyriacigeorgica]|uniref:NAD(P)-dependent oxidoreductase n=1 Tax=Nocardia cyriacigeorgica TaxID=135487 RepID=UPI00189484BB|nr:NAD(P)H-binding protein [Nocardia cyriacigeorgica]MBF6416043.1 NAD(P)H-binding protein [Nocardia cyriacigeorgica]
MKLTVFGATGGTGRHIVDQALNAGHHVTAVVRDPQRMPVSHPRLEVMTADITDTAALVPAVRSRDAVLSALAASTKNGKIATTGVRAILRAMTTVGVRRVVAVSAVPVGPVPDGETFVTRAVLTPIISRVFRDVYTDLAQMETEIGNSSTEWTIVRPPRLLDTPATGHYRVSIGSSVPRGHRIGRADLAHAMLSSIDNVDTVRQIIGVAD